MCQLMKRVLDIFTFIEVEKRNLKSSHQTKSKNINTAALHRANAFAIYLRFVRFRRNKKKKKKGNELCLEFFFKLAVPIHERLAAIIIYCDYDIK